MMPPRRTERLVVLVILAALLFTPPLILLADRPAGGLSWLAAYLFVAWALVIGLAAWLLEREPKE
ncbi:hypothetical protein SAMN05216571_103412 [Onishia taeanensis]|jgi:hypothetical protein|uniref:Uncharacterized protein n=1 Tax=Onishia taeanensis TaxID=284577 RepID=A0A1G7QU57_9GAMM|nr:hypothetical protein [Halomonas taeanensis]SDG01200.1 hypothetical protein SAMN05216571_103412 [Halomonas taeanensis]